jgi:hypothetical protein
LYLARGERVVPGLARDGVRVAVERIVAALVGAVKT